MVDETFNSILLSKCGINETEFIYLLPPQSGCSVYLFSVNVSNSSGNAGEHDTQLYHGADTPPEVIEALRTRPATAATAFTYSLTMVITRVINNNVCSCQVYVGYTHPC